MLLFLVLNDVHVLQLMVIVLFIKVALHRYRHYLINQLLLVSVSVMVQAVPAIVLYLGLELIILLIYVSLAVLCGFVDWCSGRRGRYCLFKQ